MKKVFLITVLATTLCSISAYAFEEVLCVDRDAQDQVIASYSYRGTLDSKKVILQGCLGYSNLKLVEVIRWVSEDAEEKGFWFEAECRRPVPVVDGDYLLPGSSSEVLFTRIIASEVGEQRTRDLINALSECLEKSNRLVTSTR
ncbi:MAG TPA: hypothetical protein VJL87_06440 [Bdellovibrionota bacterium]|nr:hypothetical protein [Bdellovibrionota bacterium]